MSAQQTQTEREFLVHCVDHRMWPLSIGEFHFAFSLKSSILADILHMVTSLFPQL